MPAGIAAVIVGPFVAEAAANGIRPPVRLLGHDAHAWPLLRRKGDTLCLDEFGDLWWARVVARDGTVVRTVWPEEARSLRDEICRAVAALRSRAAHPAGTANRPR